MMALLQQPIWRFYDQSISAIPTSPLTSFAMDDTLCELVGQLQSPPTLRTWVHDASVVLGIQDHRLPYIQQAMRYLVTQGYQPIVRNSGGLAVVLDKGVLNLSLVFSEQTKAMSIDDGYEAMLAFIRLLLPEATIEAYEIEGSYCPGSYDLSIDGKKFAGISQRRLRQGVAVQIYLCVEGSGSERAALIEKFYAQGLQQQVTKFSYPVIRPQVMASLNELIGQSLTVQDIVVRAYRVLATLGQVQATSFNAEENTRYAFYLQRVLDRNAKMLAK